MKVEKVQAELKRIDNIEKILESPAITLTLEALEVIAGFACPFVPPVMVTGYQCLVESVRQYEHKKRVKLLEGINDRIQEASQIELTDIKIVELYQTIQAINKTSSLEKIFFIGKLYAGYALIEEKEDVDIYEEMLNAINSLSFRQIRMLVELKDLEDSYYPNGMPDDLSTGSEYYQQFLRCCQERGMDIEMVVSLMGSATKSGFCRQVWGTYTGVLGGRFITSKYFSEVVDYARGKIQLWKTSKGTINNLQTVK